MGNGLVLLSIFSCFLSSVTNILVCIPSYPSLPNCGSLHVFISVFLRMLIVKHFFYKFSAPCELVWLGGQDGISVQNMLSFCALFSAASNGKAITSQVAVTGLSMGFGVMFGVMLLIVALLQMPCCRTNSMVALSSFGVGRRDWWKGLPTVLTEPTSLHACAPLQPTLNPPYSMYQSILNLHTLLQHTENERVIYLGYSFNVANQLKMKKSQTK